MENKPDKPGKYDDMIHLPHHVSASHPQMTMAERAAQFAPFAALTGYGESIQESSRFTSQKPELSEEERAELDYKLQTIWEYAKEHPRIAVTHFVPDKKKSGGICRKTCGRLKKIDTARQQIFLEDDTQILLEQVLDLEIDI